jgi:tRNA 2-thiouridine synthesizing protein A
MSALECLDARGLLCPLPVIRTQDRVRSLPAGAELIVTATDPGTQQDIPAWCRVHGHELVDSETVQSESGGGLVYRFRIRVSQN